MKRKLVTIGFILTLLWGISNRITKALLMQIILPVMYVQVPQWADDWAVMCS